ncbi:MAG: cell envelope integrity protein TolA [Proteobacteria bacterium]|nr:cell envelope integrity protein TolA [Pseudomonadota bacterium]
MNRCLIKKSFLFIFLIFVYLLPISATSVDTPTDDQLLELERQIEQQEIELEKAKQRAAEEARRKAEEQKLKEERAKLEEERRKLEEERKKAEAARQEETKKQAALEEKKSQYDERMQLARKALDDKDKDKAKLHFNEALAIYPNDVSAQSGIQEASKLKDKVCYDMIGTWEMKEFIGSLQIRIMEGGVFHHGTSNDNPTRWTCYPEQRQLKEHLMNSTYTLGSDGTCMTWEYRDQSNCFVKTR